VPALTGGGDWSRQSSCICLPRGCLSKEPPFPWSSRGGCHPPARR
jgi:hypothetical protein